MYLSPVTDECSKVCAPFRSLQLQPSGVLNLCLERSSEQRRWQGLCLLRQLSVRPYEVLGGKVLEPGSCRKMVHF